MGNCTCTENPIEDVDFNTAMNKDPIYITYAKFEASMGEEIKDIYKQVLAGNAHVIKKIQL